MPVHPRSLENLVTVRLKSGVTSEVHRVRAAAEVNAWFRALSAEERGDLLARVRAQEDQPEPKTGPGSTGWPEIPSRPAEGHAEPITLWVVAPQLPQRLKNDLRWAPERYGALEALLTAAGRLNLHRTNGKATWRTPQGDTLRKDTVTRLLAAGVLAPESGD